jgi:uncharacterized membrane protein
LRKAEIIPLVIILISFIVSIIIYPSLPATVVSHWGAQGEPNGHMTKFWGTFFVPILMLGLFLLFFTLVRIDPLKENIKLFRKYYDGFIIAFLLFMLYIHGLTLMYNVGYKFNMVQLLLPALGLLFIIIGVVLRKVKRNWFIGIRTPWTMSSDYVWEKTHKVGSIMFMISGVLMLIGAFFLKAALWFVIMPILLAIIITTVYSYVVFKEENKTKAKKSTPRKRKK